jgi:hypothetical protein
MDDKGIVDPVPDGLSERYRLYVDESGDHVFNHLEDVGHRFLCLLGCWFKTSDYVSFHEGLIAFKRAFMPHHPDDPPILHREDIVNRRGPFAGLRNSQLNREFDDGLLAVIAAADFKIVAVVIDKRELRLQYEQAAAHPYHLAMGFLLQRYCGFLNHVNRHGDVMAESRGGREDLLLKDSYTRVYDRGAWWMKASAFQRALTTRQLKVKRKSDNVAGLQLADLLGNPVRQCVLRREGHLSGESPPFASRLLTVVESKFNRQLYSGKLDGYGMVLFPRKRESP